MKTRIQNIDSDALDPFFKESMSESDLKYYKYFNKLWNTGYYRGTIFPQEHVKDIKNMVRKRQDTEIYENAVRLNSEEGDYILENHSYDVDEQFTEPNIIPLDIADTIAANEGSVHAIAYLADKLKNYDPLHDLRGNMSRWVSVIGRIVAEERRAKRRKSMSLGDLQTQYISPEGQVGINKIATKLLQKKHVNEVIQDLMKPLISELNDAGSDTLRRQMLIDKGLLVAALLKKGYNKKRNKTTKN